MSNASILRSAARWMLVFGIALAGVLPAAAQSRQGTIVGLMRDADTSDPIDHVQVVVDEVSRSTATNREGHFTLRYIPAGHYTFKAYRIGYEPLIRTIEVVGGDTLRLTLSMAAQIVQGDEVIVESTREATQLADASMEMEGRQLRRTMGTTIAETLADEPGIAMRSMGPAPARPVLRGLGGERLLVLEDGGRTGDLSATSTDHAVVVDPLTAERLEVIRGPAALVYGSNTLGGVINVVRDYVPRSRPDAVHLELSAQAQSVNRGYASGARFLAPLGASVALHADGSVRQGRDVQTPDGTLQNTALDAVNGSIGTSLVRPWGFAGVAGSYYNSGYGLPGGFIGAHPNGVSIEMRRYHLEAKADVLAPMPGVPRVELRGDYSNYHHQEFESNGDLGIEYGLLSYHGSLVARTAQNGWLRKGAVGLWGSYRDYAAGGFSSTPPSTEYTLAGFAYQDVHLGPVTVQGGLRYDVRQVTPSEERTSDRIGPITQRTFGGVSASAAVLWHPGQALTLGLTGMRSLRMPGIEELYSEGPHLAAYSFEIGNPGLGREIGHGAEVTARYEGPRVRGSAAVFGNWFSNYIFPRDTGEINYRKYLPIYQYAAAEARMLGAEGQASWQPHRRWTLQAGGSYVHGTLTDVDQPIPWMPPLKGTAGISYHMRALTLGTDVRMAASQTRVTPTEAETGGYTVLDLFAQYYIEAGGLLHSFDLVIENATNAAYRDHLSRVKTIMPEPGINVKVLYKLYL